MGESKTILEALVGALRHAAKYNAAEVTPPVAILWPDKDRQFAPLIPRLREAVPEILCLGPYNPEDGTGPAIWLRVMAEWPLEGADWPPGRPPVLYLPGFGRQHLRAVESCPREIIALAELQYRSAFFSHPNGKDWTVVGFLQNEKRGVGLLLKSGDVTQQAAQRALTQLADTPIAELRGHELAAEDFDGLLHPDVARAVLRWLDNPEAVRGSWTAEEWGSFRDICRNSYGFDPETEGELAAVQRLAGRGRGWASTWERFTEAPDRYPGIPDQLRKVEPSSVHGGVEAGLFAQMNDAFPQVNEREEDALRSALAGLATLGPLEARKQIEDLERQHGLRREWVWARRGWAPLAEALGHLAALAAATRAPLGGPSVEAIASAYADSGWRADAAAVDALAAVSKAEDVKAVSAAIDAVYRPWLGAAATAFQGVLASEPCRGPKAPSREAGRCLLFVDGLRMDVGHRLVERLSQHGVAASLGWSLAAIPSVTATAKPAVSPVAELLGESNDRATLVPGIAGGGKPCETEQFRKLLTDNGVQVLGDEEAGKPDEGCAWAEAGRFDKLGHDGGCGLAWRVEEEVARLADRVLALLAAGWSEVRIVTDHGWLLLPSPLPKCDLPSYLTNLRWGRCALAKETSAVGFPMYPWHWGASVTVVSAPGIHCFFAGMCYAHGGVSPQECIVPEITVRGAAKPTVRVSIGEINWVGMRCRITASGGEGLTVDLRTKHADPSSSIATAPKTIGEAGVASLLVDDDSLEGTAAFVVVLDKGGRPIAMGHTTVGGVEA